jgi:hypothetical protein
MREGLDAPTFDLPAANLEEIRSFLDAQSRFKVAVWVRHEQHGVVGPMYDHHLVLAVEDDDWETGDMRALDAGMRLPALDTREKTWIDIYPVSEVDALRSFGSVLWEQAVPGADPLDYRFTFEPFEPGTEATARFAALVAALPAVRRVGADVARLWDGCGEVESSVRLAVDAPFRADALKHVLEAARVSVLAGLTSHSGFIGRPEDSMTIIYEAAR